MITYQRETWADYRRDVQPLWEAHYDEICFDKSMPMSPDEAMYEAVERAGRLVVMTARDDGKMVGYLVGFTAPLPHYSTVNSFIEDAHFLHPDYRKGWTGVRLYREAQKLAKSLGAEIICIHTKANKQTGLILERLGYTASDVIYRRRL